MARRGEPRDAAEKRRRNFVDRQSRAVSKTSKPAVTTPLTDQQWLLVSRWMPNAEGRARRFAVRFAEAGISFPEMELEFRDAAIDGLIWSAARYTPRDGQTFMAFAARSVCGRMIDRLNEWAKRPKFKHFRSLDLAVIDASAKGRFTSCGGGNNAKSHRENFSEHIKGMTPGERQALTLLFFDGLTEHEVAGRMGVSQPEVSRLKTTALEHLRWVHNASP